MASAAMTTGHISTCALIKRDGTKGTKHKGEFQMKCFISQTLFMTFITMLAVTVAQAAQVTLAWDQNDPLPTGYRLYQRNGEAYDYTRPVWQGTGTTYTLEVPDDLQTAFVVRAYKTLNITGGIESGDSNEVVFTPPGLNDPPDNPSNLLIQAIDQLIIGLQKLRQWAQQSTIQ